MCPPELSLLWPWGGGFGFPVHSASAQTSTGTPWSCPAPHGPKVASLPEGGNEFLQTALPGLPGNSTLWAGRVSSRTQRMLCNSGQHTAPPSHGPGLWVPAICGSFFEAGGDHVACVCALCMQENICMCVSICEHMGNLQNGVYYVHFFPWVSESLCIESLCCGSLRICVESVRLCVLSSYFRVWSHMCTWESVSGTRCVYL